MQRVSAFMATLLGTCCGHSTRLRTGTVCRTTCGAGCAESDQLPSGLNKLRPVLASAVEDQIDSGTAASATAYREIEGDQQVVGRLPTMAEVWEEKYGWEC
jgi:hypothetical protein